MRLLGDVTKRKDTPVPLSTKESQDPTLLLTPPIRNRLSDRFLRLYFPVKDYLCSMKGKSSKESFTIMNELVLPNDTNTLNNLMGGRLLHWMDIAAAISAQKHCNRIVVTASVDNVSFQHPIKLGDVITIEAKVSRAFTTSVEVRLDVYAQNIPSGTKVKSNEAYYTFVALDQNGGTIPVPPMLPETDEEVELYEGALRRRQLRLILGGKMKPDDATELKALFFGAEDKKKD